MKSLASIAQAAHKGPPQSHDNLTPSSDHVEYPPKLNSCQHQGIQHPSSGSPLQRSRTWFLCKGWKGWSSATVQPLSITCFRTAHIFRTLQSATSKLSNCPADQQSLGITLHCQSCQLKLCIVVTTHFAATYSHHNPKFYCVQTCRKNWQSTTYICMLTSQTSFPMWFPRDAIPRKQNWV